MPLSERRICQGFAVPGLSEILPVNTESDSRNIHWNNQWETGYFLVLLKTVFLEPGYPFWIWNQTRNRYQWVGYSDPTSEPGIHFRFQNQICRNRVSVLPYDFKVRPKMRPKKINNVFSDPVFGWVIWVPSPLFGNRIPLLCNFYIKTEYPLCTVPLQFGCTDLRSSWSQKYVS